VPGPGYAGALLLLLLGQIHILFSREEKKGRRKKERYAVTV
jgi:hypothetical protein